MRRARRWIVPGASRVEESGWLILDEETSMLRSIYLLTCALFLMPAPASAETVNVLYAGSLVNLMEHGIGPAFDKATGDTFQGFAGGSNGLANQIKGQLRRGDVLISANPKMSDDLRGAAKGTSSTGFTIEAARILARRAALPKPGTERPSAGILRCEQGLL